MKKYLFTILMACVAVLFTACDDEFETGNPQAVEKHVGDEIVFGSSATYDLTNKQNTATRTVYGGYEQNATEEPVYWTAGDDVRIYCEQARFQVSDYSVNVSGEDVVTTSLTRKGEYSLQWGVDTQHEFYAVYPAPTTTVEGENLNGVKTIKGEVLATQTSSSYTYDKSNYKHVFAPNMRYAYMVARTNIPNRDKIGQSVYLQFRPIVTAVEITLVNNTGRNLTLNQIQCSSDIQIAGDFTADLESLTMPTSGDMRYAEGYPDIEYTASASKNVITVPTNDIQWLLGESVTFTVFMLPSANIENLNIALKAKLGDTTGYKTGSLSGVTIQKHKKTYLRGLSLSGVSYTNAEWVKAIVQSKPTTALNALSIPGAGGATSGNLKDDATSGKYRQQNLTIEQLWNKGIRCFEFAVDKAGTTVTGNTLLGNEIVLCNGNKTGIPLSEAFGQITNMLKSHPDEFAMVILAYQTLGGFGARNPSTFMTQFNIFWGDITSDNGSKGYKTKAYSPTMTVNDAKGTLFCIVRPTSIYQDYNDGLGEGIITADSGTNFWGDTTTELTIGDVTYESLGVSTDYTDIVVVKGWGALKDKWEQRGYNSHSLRQNNRPTKGLSTYNGDGGPGRPFDASTFKTSAWENYETAIKWHGANWYGNFAETDYTATVTEDFTYATTTTGLNVYAQEWARVSNLTFSTNEDIPQVDMNVANTECTAIVWNNTFDEKCNNIKNTLTKALANTGSTLYINSLCGYFISMDIPESYKPCTLTDWSIKGTIFTPWKRYPLPGSSQTSGMYGDIETYAKTINDFFNTHLQTTTNTDSKLGSMGLILLDRVGEYESSERIPQIIIANNFQFALSSAPKTLNVALSQNLENGDQLAAPAQRGVKAANGEATIVWE